MNLANKIDRGIAKLEALLALINQTYNEARGAGKSPDVAHQVAMDAAYRVLDSTAEEKLAKQLLASNGFWIKS